METHQLILVAETLLAHCRRAVDDVRRKLARPDDSFETQLSDANRTYGAIWEHLRGARDQLAAAGRDVSGFDTFCQREMPDMLHAVSRGEDDRVLVRTTEHIDVNTNQVVVRNEYRQAGTARDAFGNEVLLERVYHFNEHGLAVAAAAAVALKDAMPEVDWAAHAREAAAPAADLKSGSRRNTLIAVAAIIALLIVLYYALR